MDSISRPKQTLIADRLATATGSTLREFVLTARAAGASFGDIVWDLHSITGVRVTAKTVQLWYRSWTDEAA